MLSFRYPASTILLMTLIVAVILVILNSVSGVFMLVGPIALMFAVSYAAAAAVVGVMFALRRAGVHRLASVETWPARR